MSVVDNLNFFEIHIAVSQTYYFDKFEEVKNKAEELKNSFTEDEIKALRY